MEENTRLSSLRGFLFMTLVPGVLGGILGYILRSFVWNSANPVYCALGFIALSLFLGWITRYRSGNRKGFFFYWLVWFGLMLGLGYLISPADWAPWITPAIFGVIGTIITFFLLFSLGRRPSGTAPGQGQVHVTGITENASMNVGMQSKATGQGAVIDVGKTIAKYGDAEQTAAAAELRKALNEQADKITALMDKLPEFMKEPALMQLAKLLNIEVPNQESTTTAGPSFIEVQGETFDWGDKPRERRKR